MIGSAVVQPSPVERPTRHCGGVIHQSRPVITPSVVECMGRTTSVAFSSYNGDILIGVDVSMPQRWNEPSASFRGFAAGGASDGAIIAYPHKKVVAFRESVDYAVWLAGSNGSGGIHVRAVGAPKWTLATTSFYGEVQDGGSSNPRRTRARLIFIDGVYSYVACKRTSGSPAWGIARSADSGATWTAWSFGTGRNYTALRKSLQYACLYATADNREGSGNDGVFILTGLTGSASVLRIDNIGTGAPTLADVRDVYVGRIGTTDYVYVVVGNLSGADPDAGVWLCKVDADPTGGGFGAGNLVWTHVLTPGAADRVNCIQGTQPNTGASPIYLMVTYFKSSTNSSGTYTLSPGAGGTVKNYRVVAQRTTNGDAATPSWDVVSGAANVNVQTYRTHHDHVLTYVGETSNENGRFGGTSYSSQDLAISADGSRIVSAGKSTPWICDNPWGAVPIWQPISRGLGALEGGYANVLIPGTVRFAIADDDRGMYTYTASALGYRGPEWVIAENIDGVVSTANAMNGVSVGLTSPVSLLSARETDGRAYRTTNPFDYATAFITALYTNTGPGTCIGAFEWIDGLSVVRNLVITRTTIWRDDVAVASIASTATRVEFAHNGPNCYLHYPDLGIYRSTDNGATWVLWWNNAISVAQTAKYSGHMALVPPNTLYVTFDTPGVWLAASVDITAPGTGTGGSIPASITKVTGGALPTGNEYISAVAYDPVRGDVWACGYDPTGAAVPSLYVLRAGSPTTWFDMGDTEYGESCVIPQTMTAYDGYLQIGTASNCTLRRMA